MDNNSLSLYMHEMQNHVRHVQAGFEILNRGLQSAVVGEVLYGGQMILLPASQLASLLWPSRARARSRGEALRKVLRLEEKHPLNDRRLSEVWERSDEKMEDFVKNTRGERVVFDLVGNPFALTQEGEDPVNETSIYRAYDAERKIFYFRGIPYNIDALGRALSDVGNRVMNVYFQMFPEAAKQEEALRKQRADAAKVDAAKVDVTQKAQEEAQTPPESHKPKSETETETETETAIEPVSTKPMAKKQASKSADSTKTAAAEKPAAKKPAARKPATKKPAARKPAAEKPAAKKPAAKKPAARKPAAEKPAAEKPATNKSENK